MICRLAVIVGMHREEDKDGAMEQQKSLLEERFGAKAVVLHNVPLEISSTHLRRMLILGGADHYMNPGVLSYIRENGLYGTGRDYKNLPVEELQDVAVSLLKPKRVNHVLGCAETAVRLAEKYGADPMLARRAGLLHDITKAMDGPDQLLLLDEYDIIVSDFERNHPKLLHAKTGAGVAKYVVRRVRRGLPGHLLAHHRQAGYGPHGENRLHRRLYGAQPELSRGGGPGARRSSGTWTGGCLRALRCASTSLCGKIKQSPGFGGRPGYLRRQLMAAET